MESDLPPLGVLVLGNIVCDFRYPEGRGNPVIDKAADWDHVALFKPVIRAAKADGALVICQLSHAGKSPSSVVRGEKNEGRENTHCTVD